MEYPGGIGPTFSGAGCGVLVVALDSRCASREVFGLASLQKKKTPPSALFIPEDLGGGFLGLVSQGDLQGLFSKYLQKGQKDDKVIFSERTEN